MQNWTDEQMKFMISQWDKSIENYYPQYLEMWRNPEENFRCINEVWNLLDAVKLIDWNKYVSMNTTTILDLGGGTGWLGACLSKFNNVERVYLLDSSEYFLSYMLPEITNLMGGKIEKIFPLKGLFAPLLFDDNSLDIVVASSSLYHADNLEDILKEIYRVLKKTGYCGS